MKMVHEEAVLLWNKTLPDFVTNFFDEGNVISCNCGICDNNYESKALERNNC